MFRNWMEWIVDGKNTRQAAGLFFLSPDFGPLSPWGNHFLFLPLCTTTPYLKLMSHLSFLSFPFLFPRFLLFSICMYLQIETGLLYVFLQVFFFFFCLFFQDGVGKK